MGVHGGMLSQANVRSATVEAVIIKADGTRVSLGTVAAWHKNPIKRWAHSLYCWVKGKLR